VVLDNQAHESTGGQSTVSHSIDVCGVAAACGYPRVERATSPDSLAPCLQRAGGELSLIHVPILTGVAEPLPRPTIEPPAVAERLRQFLRRTS
jgi:phosphonopyruvate decarboxylase